MKIAVIKTGGKQYTVKENDTLKVEKIPVEEGNVFVINDVLLISDVDGKNLQLGTPTVENATVEVTVVKQGRLPKTTAIKYKPKTRYRKKFGHRQFFSEIKINKINA